MPTSPRPAHIPDFAHPHYLLLTMRTKSNHPTGFTFVEGLITLSIIGIFLMLTWGTLQFLIMQVSQQSSRNQAHFLAMEGIEIAKQIQKTELNQNAEHGFQDYFGNKSGDYVIEKKGGGFDLKAGSNEVIFSSSEPFIAYCRTLTITTKSPSLIMLGSKVQWGGVECQEASKTMAYSTYLADFKK